MSLRILSTSAMVFLARSLYLSSLRLNPSILPLPSSQTVHVVLELATLTESSAPFRLSLSWAISALTDSMSLLRMDSWVCRCYILVWYAAVVTYSFTALEVFAEWRLRVDWSVLWECCLAGPARVGYSSGGLGLEESPR